MHVVFHVLRQVKVKYVRDVGDVQAARGDVGGDQQLDAVFLEVVQQALAFFLRYVAAEHGGALAVGAQVVVQRFGGALGVDEYDAAQRLALPQ